MKVITIGEWKIKDESLVDEHDKLMEDWCDYSHDKVEEVGVKPAIMRVFKKSTNGIERIWIVDFDDLDNFNAWMKAFEGDESEEDYYSMWSEMISDKLHADMVSWETIYMK
jgi:hypothetical protein